jgi:hypothetical protein
MSTNIESLHSTGLGGFGHSVADDAADDAETAGREAVRCALAGRVPGANDLVSAGTRSRSRPASSTWPTPSSP